MDLNEVDDLLRSISKHTHTVGETEKEDNLRSHVSAIHHAKEELLRKDDIIRTMSARITQLEGQETLIHELNQRIGYLEEVEIKKEQVDAELAKTLARVAERGAEIADLSAQLAAEKSKSYDLEDHISDLQKDVSSGKDKLAENNKRMGLIEKVCENLKHEYDGSEEQLSIEVSKQIEMTNKYEKMGRDMIAMQNKHEAELKAKDDTNRKLAEDNSALHADMKKASMESLRWKRIADDLEETLRSTKEDYEEEHKELGEDLDETCTALDSTHAEYDRLRAYCTALTDRMALVDQELEELQKLGWPTGCMLDSGDRGSAGAEDDGEDARYAANVRACARNMSRVLESSRDKSFETRPPLPLRTPAQHQSSTQAHTRHRETVQGGDSGTTRAEGRGRGSAGRSRTESKSLNMNLNSLYKGSTAKGKTRATSTPAPNERLYSTPRTTRTVRKASRGSVSRITKSSTTPARDSSAYDTSGYTVRGVFSTAPRTHAAGALTTPKAHPYLRSQQASRARENTDGAVLEEKDGDEADVEYKEQMSALSEDMMHLHGPTRPDSPPPPPSLPVRRERRQARRPSPPSSLPSMGMAAATGNFTTFETMLTHLVTAVEETARLHEQNQELRFKLDSSDAACVKASDLLDGLESTLYEERKEARTLGLYVLNMVDILEKEARNARSEEYDSFGEGEGEHEDEYTARRFEELLRYKPGKESTPGSASQPAKLRKMSMMVGLAADGGLARDPLEMMSTLVGMVQGLVSTLRSSERSCKAAEHREAAYKNRVSELLGIIERLRAEHTLAVTRTERETEDRVSRALVSEWNDKLAAVEGTCQALTAELEHTQAQHDTALAHANEKTRLAAEQAMKSLQGEYEEKVNEMVIATAECEILKDQSSAQMREWALTLDKVTSYLSTLQAKYDDVVAQKRLLSVFSVGLDALRDDVMFLALSCIDSAGDQKGESEENGLDDAAVEFSPAVLHKLHRISRSGGYLEHGYPTVTHANRSPSTAHGHHHEEDGNSHQTNAAAAHTAGQHGGRRRGRKYRIPSMRVVVIHVLGILRFKRILLHVRQRVKQDLFMRYEGYNELGTDATAITSASVGQEVPGEGGSLGMGPSGLMETTMRFTLPSYSELCNLTPHQVAAFVLRSRRGRDVSQGNAYAAWASPGGGDEGSEVSRNCDDLPHGGLLAAITGQALSHGGDNGTDSQAYFDGILAAGATTPGPSYKTPVKGGTGMRKPAFLSESPYSPNKGEGQSRQWHRHHNGSPTLTMHDLTQGGTQHTRRNRFLWNTLPAYDDYFCVTQTAVLERALMYMAHQLKGLREEEEALRTTVHSLSEHKAGVSNELDESISVMEQQKAKIAALDQQNKQRERGLLKIALGHRRMAEVVARAPHALNGPASGPQSRRGDFKQDYHEQYDYDGAHIEAVNPAVLEEYVAAGRMKEAEDAAMRRQARSERSESESETGETGEAEGSDEDSIPVWATNN